MIGGILAPLYLFLLPSFDPSAVTPYAKHLAPLDYLGAILSVAALNSLIVAISFSGTNSAWNSGQIITLFGVGSVLCLVYAIQQRLAIHKTTADRILRVLSFNKKALLLFILAAACNAIAFIPVYYIPIYLQFPNDDLREVSQIRVLPVRCVLSISLLANELLMSKFGYHQSCYLYRSWGGLAYLTSALLRKFMTPAKAYSPLRLIDHSIHRQKHCMEE